MLLGGAAVEGHEPVREVRRAAVHGPFLHAVRDVRRDGGVEGRAGIRRGEELFGDDFRQVLADGLFAEHVGAEVVDRRALRTGGRVGGPGGERVEGVGAVVVHGARLR